MDTIKGVTLALLFALCGSWILRGQDPPKPICGTNQTDPTPNIALLQISCVDFEELRRVAPEGPWPAGKRTQVLVHARQGEAIKVTVGGEVQLGNLVPHQDGNLHAMVQFEGIEHTAVNVKILVELQ